MILVIVSWTEAQSINLCWKWMNFTHELINGVAVHICLLSGLVDMMGSLEI